MTAEQFYMKHEAPGGRFTGELRERVFKFAESYAAAQLAEKEREIERLRFSLYHYAPSSRLAHTTACSIWREDGQGHAVGFDGDRGPCNCGCLENFQRARAEAAEQRLQEAQALISSQGEQLLALQAEKGQAWAKTRKQAMNELRQREAELEQRWIAVGERLPEDCGQFLVFGVGVDDDGYATGGVQEAGYDLDEGWLPHNWKDHKITYWQPLPVPPKESGGELELADELTRIVMKVAAKMSKKEREERLDKLRERLGPTLPSQPKEAK